MMTDTFADLSMRLRGRQTVILGIGNPLRGDDAIGPILVDALQGRVDATLINAGEVPENYLNAIQAACPQVVLIIVALELGAEPGYLAVMDADRLRAIENFTRNPGLTFLAVMIQDGTGAEVILLGVQPKATSFAAELTRPVNQTLQRLENMLVNVY
jgi:hydrogenase 3 maturation protease